MNSFLRKFNAFLIRDLKIALSYKFNLFIQSVWFIFLFSVIFFAFYDSSLSTENSSYLIVFLNIAAVDFMFTSLNIFSKEVRQSQTTGTFESTLLTNTSFFIIIFSSYSRTFFRMILRSIFYLLICKYFFYQDLSFVNMIFVIMTLIFNSIPFIALGLISASLIIVYKVGDITNFLISILSVFFSGIFFSLDSLPDTFKLIGELTPLNLCLETVKLLINENFHFSNVLPFLKITTFEILLLFPIGIMSIHFAFKSAKRSGSLSFY